MIPLGDESSFDRTRNKFINPGHEPNILELLISKITIVHPPSIRMYFAVDVLNMMLESARSAEKHRLLPPLSLYPRGNTPSTRSFPTYFPDKHHNG
jgi:hypothetical protein